MTRTKHDSKFYHKLKKFDGWWDLQEAEILSDQIHKAESEGIL